SPTQESTFLAVVHARPGGYKFPVLETSACHVFRTRSIAVESCRSKPGSPSKSSSASRDPLRPELSPAVPFHSATVNIVTCVLHSLHSLIQAPATPTSTFLLHSVLACLSRGV